MSHFYWMTYSQAQNVTFSLSYRMLRISGSSGPRSTCSSSNHPLNQPYSNHAISDLCWRTVGSQKQSTLLHQMISSKCPKSMFSERLFQHLMHLLFYFLCILLIWRFKARRIRLVLFVCMSCFSHDHLRNCFNDCEIFHQSRRSRLKTCRNVICKNDKIPTSQRPNSKKKKQHEHALKYEHFSKVSKRFIAKLNFRLNGS